MSVCDVCAARTMAPMMNLAAGLPLALDLRLVRPESAQASRDPLVGILRPGRNLLASRLNHPLYQFMRDGDGQVCE